MAQFGSATCDFDVGETNDGKHRVISVRSKQNMAHFNQGMLTLELNQGFEMGDAKALARMLKDWITAVHFDPADKQA